MPTETQNPVAKPVVPDFGNGRYTNLMKECYSDAQHIFGITPEQAEKLARQIASDVGAAMASAQVNVKTGKSINKDGYISISEASKVKATKCTHAIYALRAMAYANECGKYGFVWAKCNFSWADENMKTIR